MHQNFAYVRPYSHSGVIETGAFTLPKTFERDLLIHANAAWERVHLSKECARHVSFGFEIPPAPHRYIVVFRKSFNREYPIDVGLWTGEHLGTWRLVIQDRATAPLPSASLWKNEPEETPS